LVVNESINIPRSAPTRPLHVKGLPQDRRVKREKIHGNLKGKSPWYAACRDPAQGAGIKIPDDVAVETGTMQCVVETSFTANGSGFGGLRTISLLPNTAGGAGENYQEMDPLSGPTSVMWLTASDFPTNASLGSFSAGVRVASAAIYVQPEVSLGSAQGEMILGWDAYRYSVATTLDDYRNGYGTSIMPINVSKPMVSRWTPISIKKKTYTAFTPPNLPSLGIYEGACPQWSLFAIVNGGQANATFRVRIVVNYEFLPAYNAIDILSANPSPCDVTDVELTETWLAEENAVGTISDAEMAKAPGAGVEEQHPQDGGDTGFGMFAEILAEVMPYALEGLTLLL